MSDHDLSAVYIAPLHVIIIMNVKIEQKIVKIEERKLYKKVLL